MKQEIVIAGYGGQGVVLAGSILANAAAYQDLHTTGMISYGAEMRGGTANSTTIISDETIGSPVVVNPNVALIMNTASLDKFESILQKNSLVIINTSECKKLPDRQDLKVITIEATKLAEEMGNKRIANFVMIGAYIKNTDVIKKNSVESIMNGVMKKVPADLMELNKKALAKGCE